MTTVPTILRRPSTLLLVAANLVPLAGVLLLGWAVFPIMLLFWMENVMVGAFNVLKMLAATPRNATAWAQKVFFIPFFSFHYGMFTAVHGIFVFTLFGAKNLNGQPAVDAAGVLDLIRSEHVGWAALALLLSHAYSFGANYIGSREYEKTTVEQLMMEPYGRVIVLHIAILGGGFLMLSLGSPKAGLALLIVLKMVIDLRGHVWQHGRYAVPGDPPP